MANQTVQELVQQLELILATDAAVAATERRKFGAAFRGEVAAAMNGLNGAEQAIPASESQRQGASLALQAAYTLGNGWIHSVHGRIEALPPDVAKMPVFTAYDFEQGNIGELDHPRIKQLLELFPVASAGRSNPDAQLPADWLTQIAAVVAAIEFNKPLTSIGDRGDKVRVRDGKRDVAEDVRSRVWHFLSYALLLRDADPLMNDYGFTPRQPASSGGGEAPAPPAVPVPESGP